MPIRINFLAELQEAEEMRRRDPLKRAIMGAVALVVAVLAWAGWYWMQGGKAEGEAKAKADQLAGLQKGAKAVKDGQDKIVDINGKLKKLEQFAVERTLWGAHLNALQSCVVDDAHLLRVAAAQNYEETASKGPDGKPRPPVATERIKVTISGRDTSKNGESYNKFKEQLQASAHFKNFLDPGKGVTLQDLSQVVNPLDPSKSFTSFTLVVVFKDKTR